MRRQRTRHVCGAVFVLAWALLVGACGSTSPGGQAESTPSRTATVDAGRCVSSWPEPGNYEAARIAAEELTTPTSSCTTISVSDVQDTADPTDRCQTFLVGYGPLIDGSLTYTKPVTACGGDRTVLAREVPDHAHYIVIYDVDYRRPKPSGSGSGTSWPVWRRHIGRRLARAEEV